MTDEQSHEVTVIIDAGARYGIHPTWIDFSGTKRYFAFEPDKPEADRLAKTNPQPWYEVIDFALADKKETRDFYITNHRGLCSFLEPDPDTEWFKRYRPGAGEIEAIIPIKTTTVDDFAAERDLAIDFLKVDTEGTEQEVLKGARQQITANVLGIRASVNFQRCYKNQPLFSETQNFLLAQNFFLLNLDYFGFGVPRNQFFRKPDPIQTTDHRYGVLISVDGVWIKSYDWICDRFNAHSERLSYATLKYAYFCMLNHAPDVAIDILLDFLQNRSGEFNASIQSSQIYQALRRVCASFLGRWRVYEDQQWRDARSIFQSIFNMELNGGSDYWAQIQSL